MTNIPSTLRRRLLQTSFGGLVGGIFALALPFAGHVALAADTQGFQISPPVTTLSLNRGTSTQGTMKVTNLTGLQMNLAVGKQDFGADGEDGQTILEPSADPLYSLDPYFSLSASTVTVPPDGTESVNYTIAVPTNAEPGGRYGAITFDTIPGPLPNGESGAAVKQELAGLILLRINGPTHEQLSVASFTTDKSFYEYGPIHFTVRVKNVGNVHEKPTGQIVVKDMLGLTTAKLTVPSQYVLPTAIRRLTAELNRHLLFGRYTATLTLHNGTVQTLTAVANFTVIPWKLLLIILVILLLIWLFLWKTRKRFGRAFRILAGKE
jgi:hypothetical protein